MNFLRALGPLLLFTGTLLGAVGSHLLKGRISPEDLLIFEKGVFYQLLNGLGLFALVGRPSFSRVGAGLLGLGTVIFCVGVYSRAIFGGGGLAAIAPFGGGLMILSWAWMAGVEFRLNQGGRSGSGS